MTTASRAILGEHYMLILQRHLQIATSNFVPSSAGAELDIFDIIHGDSIETFGPLRFTPRITFGSQAKSEANRHQNHT